MMPSKQLMRRNTSLQNKIKAALADGKRKNLILAKVERMQSKQLMRNTNLPSKKEAVLTDGKRRICESTKDAKQATHKKHKIFEARKKHHWQMENKEFYTCESKYKGPSQSKQLVRNTNLPKQEKKLQCHHHLY